MAAFILAPSHGGALAAAPPPAGGTISIESRTANGDDDPSTQAFVDAAEEALARMGFTILHDTGHSAYVAQLTLSRDEVGTARAKTPAGRAAAGPGASLGVGVGVAVPFSTGQSSLVPLRRTQFGLSIYKRGEAAVSWHAAALTVRPAGTREGADRKVAADLVAALLDAYPAQPAAVVGVP